MPRSSFHLCLAIASWPGILSGAALADPASSNSADSNAQQSSYRDSIAQESVRAQTDKVEARLKELLAELKLNGIDNADARLLAAAAGHLQSLSHGDMQKVIDALQSASITTQDAERRRNMVSAFQDQKGVALKLQGLSQELADQESQSEIPAELEDLIARQAANIRKTTTIASANLAHLDEGQKTTHDMVSAEQAAIGSEINLLGNAVAAKTGAPAPGSTPLQSGAAEALKVLGQILNNSLLKDTAQLATDQTTNGPVTGGLEKQELVRHYLASALQSALAGTPAVAQLEQARTQVEQLLGDQKELATASQQAKPDGAALAQRQNQINDSAAVAQSMLQAVNPAAARQVNQAQQAMTQSADALARTKNASDTAAQQQAATDALKKADDLLDQQIAEAQKEQALPPTDKLAQLQQLQNQLEQAAKNPQTTAANLQQLQQQALNASPQAANQIAQAQAQLQQPQPDPAAAAQTLAQAAQTVQQQAQALQPAAQQYQALQQAQQALAQAQQQAQTASQAMQATPNNLSDAAHELTQAQASVQQAQQTAQQATQQQSGAPQSGQQQTAQNSPAPPQTTAAQNAMQQAAEALKNATMQAVQAQGAQAQDQDKNAMAAMQQAQQGLSQAMAQVRQQADQAMGQQQVSPSQMAQQSPNQQGQNSQATQANGTLNPQSESGLLTGSGPAGGTAQVMGALKPKDRAAISQYQAEKSPPEYAPEVQQYLKNLADSSQSH